MYDASFKGIPAEYHWRTLRNVWVPESTLDFCKKAAVGRNVKDMLPQSTEGTL